MPPYDLFNQLQKRLTLMKQDPIGRLETLCIRVLSLSRDIEKCEWKRRVSTVHRDGHR